MNTQGERINHRRKFLAIIALLLTFSMAFSFGTISSAAAHTPPWTIPTYAYINATPNPVQVNQLVVIYFWLDKPWPSAALQNDIRPHDYKLTITKPDGTTEVKTWPIIWDPTSSQFTSYIPNQVGTYTLKFDYPGQTYTWAGAYQNDTYLPSSSTTTLTVQKDPIIGFPQSYPLPTEYWTRPIYGENPGWWSISSNWLGNGHPQLTPFGSVMSGGGSNRFVPDAVGSQTPHVMWTKPLEPGGVVGGNQFPVQGATYFEGSAYSQRFSNPIIVYGRLYYNPPISMRGSNSGPTTCVDIRTGEIVWQRSDVPTPSFAYIYDLEDPNQHGVYPAILFTSSFARAFDANTGEALFNVTGVPSGIAAPGPQGEVLRYVMTNLGNTSKPNFVLAQWNSTKLWSGTSFHPMQTGNSPDLINATVTSGSGAISTPPSKTDTSVVNASIFDSSSMQNRYDWNVSIPWRNTMTRTPTVIGAVYNDIMLCFNGTSPVNSFNPPSSYTPYTYFAINLNASKGPIGSVLWWNTLDVPPNNITVTQGGFDPYGRVFLEGYKETMQWVAYNLDTGQKMWGPTAPQAALDYYGIPGIEDRDTSIAYGKVYSAEYSGITYCYDEQTGKLLWTYGNGGPGNSTESGYEVPGNYPMAINAIGNGIIYMTTTEHTINSPIYKGALLRALNATDGTEIWTIGADTNEFHTYSLGIADGFTIFANGYDNQIYSVGRGPSQTTVTASPKVSTLKSGVLIEGTVMDTATGTKQDEQIARFPAGVPAVSDASMKDWMGYIYQQKPRPKDTVGVTVALSVLDSNHNTYSIGNVTTDANGAYHLLWQPPISGDYVIYATFTGTDGYWPSNAETAIGVTEAPPSPQVTTTPTATIAPTLPPVSPTATPTTAPPPKGGVGVETYIAIGAAVIIIAVAAAALVLRRKK